MWSSSEGLNNYIPIDGGDDQVIAENVMKLKPVYADELRDSEYYPSHGYHPSSEIPSIHVEIFRDGSLIEKAYNDVLSRGLSKPGDREFAAQRLGIKNIWKEDPQYKRECDQINKFCEVYWREVLSAGKVFRLGFSGEGQHRLLMCISTSCGSAYDHKQPYIKENSISKDVFKRSGMFRKKEHIQNKTQMMKKLDDMEECSTLVDTSIKEGALSSLWSIFISTTKSTEELNKSFNSYSAEMFHFFMRDESEDTKIENKSTSKISSVERIMSFIVRLEEDEDEKHKTINIEQDRIAKLPKDMREQKEHTVGQNKIENEQVYNAKYEKPKYLLEPKLLKYLNTGEESDFTKWRKFIAEIIYPSKKGREFPPFRLCIEDTVHEKDMVDLVALNNTLLYREFLYSFHELGDIQEQESVRVLAKFLLHHHNESGLSFSPMFHQGVEYDEEVNIEGNSNLVHHPKLASTILLSYVFNSCMLYDKNALKFKKFLHKLRVFELGPVKLEETLGEYKTPCSDFPAFQWIFQSGVFCEWDLENSQVFCNFSNRESVFIGTWKIPRFSVNFPIGSIL